MIEIVKIEKMKTPRLFLFLASFLFFGCYTEKKAKHDLVKAQTIHPAVVANFARTFYPAVDIRDTVTRIDTAYRYAAIDCDTIWKIDTLRFIEPPIQKSTKANTKYVTVPGYTIYQTKIVKDTIEISLCEYRLQECEEEKQMWIAKADKRSTRAWWLLVALAISIILNILQLRK